MRNKITLLLFIMMFLSCFAFSQNKKTVVLIDSTDQPSKTIIQEKSFNEPSVSQVYYNQPDTAHYSNLYSNYVGMKYSTVNGYGLSYMYKIKKTLSINLTIFASYSETTEWKNNTKNEILKESKDNIADYGLEIKYDLYAARTTVFYVSLGGYYGNEENQSTSTDKNLNKETVGGLGAGILWYLSKNFVIDLSIGYKFQYTQTDKQTYSETGKTIPGFGFGLFYSF